MQPPAERLKAILRSQTTLLVWSCSNHLQKNQAQITTWTFLMIQSVSFTSAASETFAEAILCFLVSASTKQNGEVIRFLESQKKKKNVSKNETHFCSKKKSNVSLNKTVIFVFHTIFKLDFKTRIIYCIIHRCPVFSFHTFLLPYISL